MTDTHLYSFCLQSLSNIKLTKTIYLQTCQEFQKRKKAKTLKSLQQVLRSIPINFPQIHTLAFKINHIHEYTENIHGKNIKKSPINLNNNVFFSVLVVDEKKHFH